MPAIQDSKLAEFIDRASSTITLYREGSMRSGQKLPVSHAAMERAIREVEITLFRNKFHASFVDLQNARDNFIHSLLDNIHAERAVLNEADKSYLRAQILKLRTIELAAGEKPIPIRSRFQPPRVYKRPKF